MTRRIPDRRRHILLPALVVGLVLGAGCGNDAAPPPPSPTLLPAATATPTPGPVLSVVATNPIAGDWARQVGGGRLEVSSLVPPGRDPHSFRPSARDVARVARADLVLSMGLSLEAGWLEEVLRNAAADPSLVVTLGEVVDPLGLAGTGDAKGGTPDPHFWFDPLRAKAAVEEIAGRLSQLDPASADVYRANAASYARTLEALDAWIRDQVASVDPERRVLATSHDSYRYLAAQYGLRVVGAVLSGGGTEREPSAEELVALVNAVRENAVPVVFTEAPLSDRFARSVASEVGVEVVALPAAGSLGDDTSATATYIGLMRVTVTTMIRALT